MNIAITILLVIFAIIFWWWFVGRNTPKFPPLEIENDDPLMIEAIEKARSSLGKFKELYANGYATDIQVKVPFLSNSGITEHLWAEVIELDETAVKVRYLTPPATHNGKLERVHSHPHSDIEDWVVFTESGDIYGGYSQRVMFKRGREQWGSLPPELEKQESRYVA